ncbi:FTR1 family iron permease [Nitrososphaera sp.]|uniref:FTR1 family iron permease n=1 Tax=Nitrososphaera sp. TaxID=1971748 RepID=UPI002EDA3DE2
MTALAVLAPSVASAQTEDARALIIIVNMERIRAQLLLTQQQVDADDSESAFAHAFISHTTIFPAVKPQLQTVDSQKSTQLESALTDLSLKIKSGGLSAQETHAEIQRIEGMVDGILAMPALAADKGMASQAVVFLLRDAVQSYELSESGANSVDYESAQGLVQVAKSKYRDISDFVDARRSEEINSFIAELDTILEQKAPLQDFSRLVQAIERDLSEELTVSSGATGGQHTQYFATIRTLLAQVVDSVKAGDYRAADQAAITAYLDNYEYLEAPIEKHDPELMVTIELEMREELRKMIKAGNSPAAIENFLDGILVKLDDAEAILDSDPELQGTSGSAQAGFADIEGLSQGFDTYQGERLERGEAEDAAKAAVRADIDQIRIKLDETLRLYQEGNKDGALLTARSAYLDSYENVELPLRPIDPDFTLDMEIKFAELRNLMQAGAPYEQVLAKTAEIKNGLDESERLVSGTGIVAPTIAFSTSFSIIFREGLESALIIGAILTYLEASRNERFKKHVYYGIVLAFAGTAATWFAAEYIIEISGAGRELIEAIAGISAVAVLFWVSFWILNKVETKKWIEFVKAKVWKATTTGSVMVFVMLSFFTVYREGFETVLFYQAMLSFAKYMEWYVAAGLISGLAVIVATTFLVRKLGRKLPLRVLFGLTMGIGAYMSIAFMGNAIREFQEVGYIQTTHLIGTVPRLDINLATMTGIHPTLETIIAQVVLLAVYLAGSMYVLVLKPRRQRMVESARKSRADLVSKQADIDVEDH